MKLFRTAIPVAAFLVAAVPLSAQWFKVQAPNVPRLPDGKPNMNAPAPKTADGKPDLSGIWEAGGPPLYMLNLARDLKPGELEMTPWAEQLYNQRKGAEGKDDPSGYCVPGGVPRAWNPPYPFKIVTTPSMVIVLYEAIHGYRQFFTDGRELPKDPNPTWYGYSTGKWEGDTFVATTVGMKEGSWLDNDGHPGSEGLKVTERFNRKTFGQMEIRITIEDPKAYRKPWNATLRFRPVVEGELIEFICAENEKDTPHMVGK